MKEKFLKLWLKFGILSLCVLACALVFWFFVPKQSAQISFQADKNASEHNKIALNSHSSNTSTPNLTNWQAFTQINEQNATQMQDKQLVKGLFVDYDENEFNASEFKISDKISVETNLSANLNENSNKKLNLNALDEVYSSKKLNLDTLSELNSSAKANLSALNEQNSNPSTHSKALNELNSTLIVETGKILLPQKKYHKDLAKLLKSDYVKSFFAPNADRNKDTKSTPKTKPKLCIIIDDMANKEQVSELKATGLKLTPSFFPADTNHPKTPILAREFEFFMVHLPLSAVHYSYEEKQTLKPEDSQEHINATIAQIVKDFKGLKFINNHTGSLFTDDTQAMRKLFHALKQHNLIFVDSMTIGSSKGLLVSKEFNQTPIKRDIFLDNENDISTIKAKIKQAVQKAHKKGFAIAIAHPKKNTFKALEQSKALLESVELVYLSEIYANP